MEIIVCVKRVAKTDTRIKVAADGKSIDRAGVEYELNPYDEFAIEQALATKEALGIGSVTVVTLGGDDAQKELRTCLAMGADKAVLIDDGGRWHDAFATAEVIAAWMRGVQHDLVFCGKQAVDGDDCQFGPRLATLLELPCVTEVVALALDGGVYRAERDIEGGREIVRCPTPAVITTHKGLNQPRYANLKGIMAAKKKPLEKIAAAEVAPATAIAAVSLPPERPPGRVVEDVGALVEALKNEAKVI